MGLTYRGSLSWPILNRPFWEQFKRLYFLDLSLTVLMLVSTKLSHSGPLLHPIILLDNIQLHVRSFINNFQSYYSHNSALWLITSLTFVTCNLYSFHLFWLQVPRFSWCCMHLLFIIHNALNAWAFTFSSSSQRLILSIIFQLCLLSCRYDVFRDQTWIKRFSKKTVNRDRGWAYCPWALLVSGILLEETIPHLHSFRGVTRSFAKKHGKSF